MYKQAPEAQALGHTTSQKGNTWAQGAASAVPSTIAHSLMAQGCQAATAWQSEAHIEISRGFDKTSRGVANKVTSHIQASGVQTQVVHEHNQEVAGCAHTSNSTTECACALCEALNRVGQTGKQLPLKEAQIMSQRLQEQPTHTDVPLIAGTCRRDSL